MQLSCCYFWWSFSINQWLYFFLSTVACVNNTVITTIRQVSKTNLVSNALDSPAVKKYPRKKNGTFTNNHERLFHFFFLGVDNLNNDVIG